MEYIFQFAVGRELVGNAKEPMTEELGEMIMNLSRRITRDKRLEGVVIEEMSAVTVDEVHQGIVKDRNIVTLWFRCHRQEKWNNRGIIKEDELVLGELGDAI